MNTENTETIRGWVFYDADCALCRGWAGRTHDLLLRHGYHLAPLQAKWIQTRLGLKDGEPLIEMKLLTADGRIFGGADALIRLTRSIWWAWPIFIFAQIPGIKPLLRIIYRTIARNRHCHGNRCQIASPSPKHHRHLTSSFYEMP